MEQAHPTGCLNTKKSAKIPLSSKKMVLSLTATFTAGNFPGQIYFYTAGFELFGRGHGHLATVDQASRVPVTVPPTMAMESVTTMPDICMAAM